MFGEQLKLWEDEDFDTVEDETPDALKGLNDHGQGDDDGTGSGVPPTFTPAGFGEGPSGLPTKKDDSDEALRRALVLAQHDCDRILKQLARLHPHRSVDPIGYDRMCDEVARFAYVVAQHRAALQGVQTIISRAVKMGNFS